MIIDFSAEYSHRSDDELLHLASQRHTLTPEAAAALDAELRLRKLTESDRLEHQKFVRRQERHEGRRRRWKIPGFKDRLTWREVLKAFAAMAIISAIYLAVPRRYRLAPDWEEAAVTVMIASVLIVFAFRSWREFSLWMSLGISSAIHLVVVHSWTRKIPSLSRSQGKGAALVGFVLFVVVYSAVRFLQRVLYVKEAPDNAI